MRKGFRKGIDVVDIIKNLTKEEKEWIKLRHDLNTDYVNNKDAYECAVRSDQLYNQTHDLLSTIDAYVVNIMSSRTAYLENAIQVKSDNITLINSRNNQPYTKRDLTIEMITMKRVYQDTMRKLWISMTTLWRYVGVERLDSSPSNKKIFYDEDKYKNRVSWIREQLKVVGLDYYDERAF